MHEWFSGAGPIVTLIWVVAGLGVLLTLDRVYVVLARSGFNGRPFIERIIQLVRSGKTDEAIKVCTATRTILSDIALLVLRTRTRDETDLQNIAEAASLSLVPRLNRRIHFFRVLAITSAALGTIGLLDGLRVAFERRGAAGADSMSVGIADALRAPEVGIAVAAVLILAQGFFSGQAEQVVEQVDELSARLVNALIDRPDVRLGHR
jgi:biopolymer transport protein ExbB/TolQ